MYLNVLVGKAVDACNEALDEGFDDDDDKTCNQNFLATLILSCTSLFTISRTLQDVRPGCLDDPKA